MSEPNIGGDCEHGYPVGHLCPVCEKPAQPDNVSAVLQKAKELAAEWNKEAEYPWHPFIGRTYRACAHQLENVLLLSEHRPSSPASSVSSETDIASMELRYALELAQRLISDLCYGSIELSEAMRIARRIDEPIQKALLGSVKQVPSSSAHEDTKMLEWLMSNGYVAFFVPDVTDLAGARKRVCTAMASATKQEETK